MEAGPRRFIDELRAWSNPVLLAVCGIFLVRMMNAIDANTSAINQQAITLTQLQVMINNNVTVVASVGASLDKIREQQLDLAQRLTRIEARSDKR